MNFGFLRLILHRITDIIKHLLKKLLALLEKPDTNWLHFGYNQNVTKMQPKRKQNVTKMQPKHNQNATKTPDTNWLHFGYNQNVTKT